MHMQAKTAGPLLVDSSMVPVAAAVIVIVVVVVEITLRTHFDANSKHCTSTGPNVAPLSRDTLSWRRRWEMMIRHKIELCA